MSEKAGAVPATRSAADSLGARYGLPDSTLTDTVAIQTTATEKTDLVAHKWYRFHATTACHLMFGAAGDADSGDLLVPAGATEHFYTGHLTRVSVIRDTADGTLYVTPMITDDKDT